MSYNPHNITYGYDTFTSGGINYEPLNLDPAGRNFEYNNNNSVYHEPAKKNLPLSYDPMFINNNLNESYINNKLNIENYFIKDQLNRLQPQKDNINIVGDNNIIPENGYGTKRNYYFLPNEHMTDKPNSICIKNILIILILVYLILNIIIHKYEYMSNSLNLYKKIINT